MIYLQIGISVLLVSILYAICVKYFYFSKYRQKIELLEKEIEERKIEIDRLSDLLDVNKKYPPHISVSIERTEVYEEMQKIMTDLLNGKIRLCNVPFEKRILSYSPYFMAFRHSRSISKERCLEDLNVLKSDLKYVKNINLPCRIDNYLLELLSRNTQQHFMR